MNNKVTKYLNFMLQVAADDSHGYDQTHRNGPDYDCSSLVGTALNYAGFDVSPYSWTGNLASQLLKCGFNTVSGDVRLPGDIHLTPGKHVCVSVNEDEVVHARINELGKTTGGKTGDQTGKEISVSSYYVPSYGWKYHFRYTPTETLTSNEIIARQVLLGMWGNGPDRKLRLFQAGYDYQAIQNIVNQLINNSGKLNAEIAREVLQGKWGNNPERKERLIQAGYDYEAIREIVNDVKGGVS